MGELLSQETTKILRDWLSEPNRSEDRWKEVLGVMDETQKNQILGIVSFVNTIASTAEERGIYLNMAIQSATATALLELIEKRTATPPDTSSF